MAGKYIMKRGNIWWVKKRLPKHLAAFAGYTHIRQSTGTGDSREAQRKALQIVADELRRLEGELAAEGGNPADPRWLQTMARDLSRQVAAGEMTDAMARVLLSEAQDLHFKATGARVDREGHPLLPARHEAAIRAAHARLNDPAAIPLSEAVDTYLKELKSRELPASTRHKKKRTLSNFAAWLQADLPISKITRQHIGQYLSQLLSEGRSEATNGDIVGMLSAFWNWAIRRGHSEQANPWVGMKEDLKRSRRGTAADDTKMRPFTRAELGQFVQAVSPKDVHWHLFVLAAYTGCRREEICAAKVEHVDLEEGLLIIAEGKTKSSRRQIPLHPIIKPLVRRLVESSADGHLLPSLGRGGLDKTRGKVIGQSMGRLIRKHVTEDRRATFHSTRRSFAQACETAGIPQHITECITGHTRQSLSFGLYSPGPEFHVLRDAMATVSYGTEVDHAVRDAVEASAR